MKQADNQSQSHELQVFATNGRVFHVSLETAWEVVSSPLYLWALVLFSVMVALFDAPVFDVELPFIGRFLYWLVDCLWVSAIAYGHFRLMLWLINEKRLPLHSYNMVSNFFGISTMVWLNYLFSVQIFDMAPLSALQVWGEVLRYLLIAVVFEILAVSSILPRFENVHFGKIPAPSDHAPAVLRVNAQEVPLDRLSYIKSIEHYVELVTDEGALMERAPLKGLVEQLGLAEGIQPHRSYWVARRAEPVLQRAGDNHVLRLRDGTEIPVSRGRRKAVESWLAGVAAE